MFALTDRRYCAPFHARLACTRSYCSMFDVPAVKMPSRRFLTEELRFHEFMHTIIIILKLLLPGVGAQQLICRCCSRSRRHCRSLPKVILKSEHSRRGMQARRRQSEVHITPTKTNLQTCNRARPLPHAEKVGRSGARARVSDRAIARCSECDESPKATPGWRISGFLIRTSSFPRCEKFWGKLDIRCGRRRGGETSLLKPDSTFTTQQEASEGLSGGSAS